jgi:hypothetical protein
MTVSRYDEDLTVGGTGVDSAASKSFSWADGDAIVVFPIVTDGGTPTVSSITTAGANMGTFADAGAGQFNQSAQYAEVWFAKATGSGSGTITITLSEIVNVYKFYVVQLRASGGSIDLDSSNGMNTTASSTPSFDITNSEGEGYIIAGASVRNATITPGAAYTEVDESNEGAGYAVLIEGTYSSSGAVTVDIAVSGTPNTAFVGATFYDSGGGGGGTDALTGQDITAGTPTISQAALGQVHGLAGQDISAGTPTVSQAAIGQIHALSGQDITSGTPTVSQPELAQTHDLGGQDVNAGTPTISQPALGQVHALTGQDITAGTPTVSQPTLTEGSTTDVLTGQDISAGVPTISQPELGQIHALSAADISAGAPTITAAALGQVHDLTAADITTGTPTISQPVLTAVAGVHPLTGQDITVGVPIISQPALGQIHALTGQDIVAGTPTISQPVLFDYLAIVGTYGTVSSAAEAGAVVIVDRQGNVVSEAGEGTVIRAVATATVKSRS